MMTSYQPEKEKEQSQRPFKVQKALYVRNLGCDRDDKSGGATSTKDDSAIVYSVVYTTCIHELSYHNNFSI